MFRLWRSEMVGVQAPNWVDLEVGAQLETATAPEALAILAKCPRMIQAVEGAIRESEDAASRNIKGPSRGQRIRKAISEVLVAN
jgi:hypothetical protein